MTGWIVTTCLVSKQFTTSNGMIDYYETKSQPISITGNWCIRNCDL